MYMSFACITTQRSMAAPCNLLRSVGYRILAVSRILREAPTVQCNRPFTAKHTVRQQHTDTFSKSDEAPSEKTPIMIDNDLILKMIETENANMPMPEIPDPYQKEHKRCILCKHDVDIDYKNVKLLSQFVSPFTGRIYGRAVTGLCIPMQKEIARAIKQSRRAGYMPYMLKKSEFLKDPRLFDPFKPAK